jgi:hypothetical protein
MQKQWENGGNRDVCANKVHQGGDPWNQNDPQLNQKIQKRKRQKQTFFLTPNEFGQLNPNQQTSKKSANSQ